MSLRKIYNNFLAALRFYSRHLFPLLKRWFRLAFRKEKRVSLEIQVTQGELIIEGRFVMELIITARNIFIIHVNGLRIPVFRDNSPFKVQLALEKEVRSITLCGRGIKHHKTRTVSMSNNRMVATSVWIKRKVVVEEPAILSPVVKPRNQWLSIRPLALHIKTSSFPTIKRTPFIRSQALTEDLFEQLAHNSKTNEQ